MYWDKNGNDTLDDDEPLIKTANTTSAAANYTFSQLPAGDYIVKVDATDPQLPTGYSTTTPEFYAATLINGQAYVTADFGFGPTLRVDKHLDTTNPAVVGETVTFHIDLINTRPGDGTANGYCTYYVFPSTTATDSNTNKQFANIPNAVGAPNNAYASASYSTGGNQWISGSGFNALGRTSSISTVQVVLNPYLEAKLNDDSIDASITGLAAAWSGNFSTAQLNTVAIGEGKKDYLLSPTLAAATYAPGGTWTWDDFSAATLRLDMNKQAGAESTSAVLHLDTFGFYVTTTDTSCATGDSTIATLPFTDTYNTTQLQFISAEPPVTDSSTPGTLLWNNLGPLYAGGTKTVSVSFKALTAVTGSLNTASVQNAKFSSGRDVNNASDTATVDVNASGSISGHVFADTNATGTWNSPTGYSGGDTFFSGVKVNLRACISNVTGIALPIAEATNQPCTGSNNNGTWQTIATQYINSSGAYTFSGLRDGAGGSSGDDNWNSEAANLSTNGSNFNNIVNGASGENITAVSFGYRDDGSNQGAVIGYVWHDVNANGQWLTSSENPLAGITVELCGNSDCSSILQTTTTDSNGRYAFGNVTPGSVYVRVTPPNGMTQSGDPDNPNNPCGGACDNQTTNPVTVAINAVTNAGNFGYTGGYTLGDTIYTDWNGNGSQGSGETGIENVLVYLYRDTNGNGSIDSGEPLLATATTNGSGFYQFTNLPGNGARYIVRVADASIPSGYTLTGDPVGALDNHAAYELTNASVDTADFGYQPRGFGSIGDTIWNDANGNGVQDTNETGIQNVIVNLYLWDDDGDNIYETGELNAQVDTQTTNASGNYAFQNLPAGKFLVQVDSANFGSAQPLVNLTLSGDPDSTADNLHPVSLAAAQSYTAADFGYTSSAIGDLIWQDNDADGVWDSGEPGINGVIVDLFLDADNDGTANGAAIATATTANNSQGKPGYYLFGGLSANNYIIKVRASNFNSGGALEGYTQTGDPNASSLPCSGGECDNTNWLKGITAPDSTSFPGLQLGQTDLSSDFGYKPAGGVIGDTVWIDTNNNDSRDPGERGIAYVTVKLCTTSNCSASQTTTTDENGYYSFSGLANSTSYWVQVDTTDPNFPADLTATYDRDDTPDSLINNIVLTSGNVSTVNSVSCATNCDLEMDFGYRFSGNNNISGTIWHDTDSGGQSSGIGDIDTEETIRYEGVPVYLWRCVSGCGGTDDLLVSQTTSANDGTYSFPNLANGDYRVVANPNAYSVKGMTTTTPTAYSGITLSGSTNAQRDFGFLSAMDFGDLPNNVYNATLIADNGARHTINSLKLGTIIDNDTDGQGSTGASASGDDLDGSDDDDGVTINGDWEDGATGGKIAVTVSGCTGTCYLSGWLDWNGDGDFTDAKERILLDVPVTDNGGLPQSITFNIPTGTIDGTTPHAFFTRFRVYSASTNGLAQPTGLVSGGEVEDYLWNFGPNAVTLQTFKVATSTNLWLWLGATLLLTLSAATLLKKRRQMLG